MLLLSCVLLATITRPCSISDRDDYNALCQNAADKTEVFAQFRKAAAYYPILEHVSYEQGKEYLRVIKEQTPELLDRIELFRSNDTVGNPVVYFYEGVGVISPTTLRYIKVASDLLLLFGPSLEGSSIIEIGAGYGGQCKILSDLFHFKKYTIIDLPGPLALTKKYLETQKVQNVIYKAFDESIAGQKYDLVISNFAYTECTQEMREKYDEEILAHSKRGYLTCSDEGFLKAHFFHQLRKINIPYAVTTENPITGRRSSGEPNYLVTWESL